MNSSSYIYVTFYLEVKLTLQLFSLICWILQTFLIVKQCSKYYNISFQIMLRNSTRIRYQNITWEHLFLVLILKYLNKLYSNREYWTISFFSSLIFRKTHHKKIILSYMKFLLTLLSDYPDHANMLVFNPKLAFTSIFPSFTSFPHLR